MMPDLSTLIIDRRLSMGLTQAELARCANVSESAISLIEANKRGCSLRTAFRIAECLNIPRKEIIDTWTARVA